MAFRGHFGLSDLPTLVGDLSPEQRNLLANVSPGSLPSGLADVQRVFCDEVAAVTVRRWNAAIGSTRQRRTDFAMSLLRIPQAIYFLLGQNGREAQRYKVLSRWDWAARYRLRDFTIAARQSQQPTVTWRLVAHDRELGHEVAAEGHVEIRWGHGRFKNAPEAKAYLDSPLSTTPGYVSLESQPTTRTRLSKADDYT